MRKRDQVKLAVLETLKEKPLSMFDLVLKIDLPESTTPLAALGEALGELEHEGYVTKVKQLSSVTEVYSCTHEWVLSDLRAKVLPLRDPVREAHEYENYQPMRARYRRPSSCADLDMESGS